MYVNDMKTCMCGVGNLKVVTNEKVGGSGRWQMLGNGLRTW
jgi:hypothetical protein